MLDIIIFDCCTINKKLIFVHPGLVNKMKFYLNLFILPELDLQNFYQSIHYIYMVSLLAVKFKNYFNCDFFEV